MIAVTESREGIDSMGIFARKQETEKELSPKELEKIAKEQAEQSKKQMLQDLGERAMAYKHRWDKNGTVQFKNEYVNKIKSLFYKGVRILRSNKGKKEIR